LLTSAKVGFLYETTKLFKDYLHLWLIVEQLDASQQDINYHINQIYDDGEQDSNRTHKKFLLVRQEGARRIPRLFLRIYKKVVKMLV
jgi:hypothetical protein